MGASCSSNAAVSTVFTDTLASIAKHSWWACADLGLTPGAGTLDRYSVKPATRSASP
jgi:hypothetical protein